jgi:hypothetical protein
VKVRDGVAVITLVLLAVAGGWLVAAPFLLHYQPTGAHWTGSTRLSLWFGVGLLGLGMLSLAGYATAALREVVVRNAPPGRHERRD